MPIQLLLPFLKGKEGHPFQSHWELNQFSPTCVLISSYSHKSQFKLKSLAEEVSFTQALGVSDLSVCVFSFLFFPDSCHQQSKVNIRSQKPESMKDIFISSTDPQNKLKITFRWKGAQNGPQHISWKEPQVNICLFIF